MAFRRVSGDGRTTVELICNHIRERITVGALVPGQRITQRDIQQTLQVSPGSAREAFRALAGEGLLDHQSHRGAIIRAMTRVELSEIYRLREVVEGLAARMAAERASVGCDVAAIQDLLQQGEAACAANDYRAYSQNNREFHDAIYDLCGSSRTATAARTLVLPIHRIHVEALVERRAMLHSINSHRAIVAAITSGDPQAAEDEMRSHVRDSGALLLRTLPPVTSHLSGRRPRSKADAGTQP